MSGKWSAERKARYAAIAAARERAAEERAVVDLFPGKTATMQRNNVRVRLRRLEELGLVRSAPGLSVNQRNTIVWHRTDAGERVAEGWK